MNFHEMRRHITLGVVHRLARTPSRNDFVLRGGLLTAMWLPAGMRPTRDLDFVGDYAFDVEDTQRRFAPALAVALDDNVVIAPEFRATGIWLDTEWPGVRLWLRLGYGAIDQELSVDIGFGDPIVPASVERDGIRCVRPETQVGWKLHALAEMTTDWRPKDIADLDLITQHVPLVDEDLALAIRTAFESRHFTVQQAIDVLRADHWPSKTSRLRWGKPDLAATLARIRARLDPVLDQLANDALSR
ncbi:MAG TPA: nucleotidyl transferase AbiEii/AbiGii toxin family protein [Kofleriaceae bacterium]